MIDAKEYFDLLVKGLRRSNAVYLFDKTLDTLLDYVEGATNPTLIIHFTNILTQVCEQHKILVERIVADERNS